MFNFKGITFGHDQSQNKVIFKLKSHNYSPVQFEDYDKQQEREIQHLWKKHDLINVCTPAFAIVLYEKSVQQGCERFNRIIINNYS